MCLINLAAGSIIDAAFGGIVASLVKCVSNPIIGVFPGDPEPTLAGKQAEKSLPCIDCDYGLHADLNLRGG